MGPALMAVILVAYNNAANRWKPFHGPAYVPMNVSATVLVYIAGRDLFGLSGADIGWRWSNAWVGALPAAALALVLAALLARRRTRGLLADQRLAGVRGWQALYMVLVRIPVGTAALEEIAFRGVLFAAFMPAGTIAAVAFSSLAFGAWHVVPTMNLLHANGRAGSGLVLAGAMSTAVAGVALCILRVKTGSLGAPFLAHALTNSVAAGAGIAAHYRARAAG